MLTEKEIQNCTSVLEDAQDKFVLCIGHRSRCTNQSTSIKSMEKKIQKLCIKSKGDDIRGIQVMDFKMKFNPINARESTIDYYGKRGISWHGFCLIYYMYDENTKEATKYCAYLDQILSDWNKQDMYCVLSLKLDSNKSIMIFHLLNPSYCNQTMYNVMISSSYCWNQYIQSTVLS